MKLRTIILALFLAVSSGSAFAQSNPFSGRSTGEQAPPTMGDEAASTPLIVLPAPVRAVFRQIADWQRDLNRFLGGKLRESSQQGSWLAALTVLMASFAYGVLHAAGPGHGKMVVASYFTAKKAPLKTGILMGGVIALTQAVVAVAVVGILAIIIGRSQRQVMSDANWLELASYGVIFGIGAYMTYCAFRGTEAFAHDHGPPASTFDDTAATHAQHAAHQHDHGHAHGHEHHHHDHQGHKHSHHDHHNHDHHGAHGNPRETWLAKIGRTVFGRDGEVVAVGIVSGVRPCTGSILVLLFSLANGVFWLGITAAFFIAFGVAITVSVLGIATIVLRRSVAGHEHNAAPWRAMANRALTLAGSIGVMVMGGLLFGGALELNGLI
jgi:nickel/cobalt transporter (NicO) family protein